MSVNTPAYGRRIQSNPAMLANALRRTNPVPFWLDSAERPDAEPLLTGAVTADLAIVGGGYTGLWTALQAKEADPDLDIVVLEARQVAWAASGRNGGFCEASLTHGTENGLRHFARELPVIDRLADENFIELENSLGRHGIDAEFEKTGVLQVATEQHQIAGLAAASAPGSDVDNVFLDESHVREMVDSPLYRAGLFSQAGEALVNPARLAWGLKRACHDLGVRFFEHTPVSRIERADAGMRSITRHGRVDSRQVALATNGFPSLLKRTRLLTIPVYDYVLVTEPLTAAQLAEIGWTRRHGITDSSRQFHYYRLTSDNRILWGGYDAVYHRGGRIRDRHDQRPETFQRLADHFFLTFPQLADLRFTHAWGGMIDMSTRFTAFFGRAYGGRVAYTAGFTGLGVAATRFGARVMLDLLSGAETEITSLRMVRSKPLPVPPEPFAYPAIQLTRDAIAKSDSRGGRDGMLLRMMNVFGVGFDS